MTLDQLSLFDDVQRSDLRSRFNSEPSFPYLNVSGRPSAAHVRELMDTWYLEVPEQARTDLRARFRSPDDVVYLGAFTELYCMALLRHHGFNVQVHANASSKGTRIDFLATLDGTPMFLLESVVSGDYQAAAWERKLTRSLYDQLNKLQHPDFFVVAELRHSGTHSPSGQQVRHYVESKLNETDWEVLWLTVVSGNEPAIPEWVWETDDWEISFKPIPKSPEFRGLVDTDSLIVGVQMDRVRSDQPGAAWMKSLKKKASRCGIPELPYIIAVNGLSISHRLSTLPDALFGLREVVIDLTTKKGTPGRAPNGFWWGPQGPRYTRVSGVLALERVGPWSVAQQDLELWHNPWAAKLIDPEWWQVTQGRSDGAEQMTKREGKTASELFELVPSWPETDEEA